MKHSFRIDTMLQEVTGVSEGDLTQSGTPQGRSSSPEASRRGQRPLARYLTPGLPRRQAPSGVNFPPPEGDRAPRAPQESDFLRSCHQRPARGPPRSIHNQDPSRCSPQRRPPARRASGGEGGGGAARDALALNDRDQRPRVLSCYYALQPRHIAQMDKKDFSRCWPLDLGLPSLQNRSQLPYCEYPLEGPLWQGTDVSSQQPARTVGLVNELGSRSSHTQALI
nr:uncharacterized protein LOC112425610 [Macaca nemestrina]